MTLSFDADRGISGVFPRGFAPHSGPVACLVRGVRRFPHLAVAVLCFILLPTSSTLRDIPPVAPLIDPFVRGMNKITPLENGRVRVTRFVRKKVDPLAQPIWKTIPASSFLLLGTAMLVAGRRLFRRATARVSA